MTSHPEDHRPYVLWFETLSNGETLTVVIWPRAGRAELAVQRNHQLERGEHCDTVDLAERRGWELHRSVLRGEFVN